MGFEIIPAIDIRGGRCVRLYQGDFGRETSYFDSPVEAARHWASQGASWLHIVDLDGAREGRPVNLHWLREIAETLPVLVQYGGGLRSVATVQEALSAGARRVVLGTVAALDTEMTKDLCHELGEAVAIGIDSRSGWVQIQGWTAKAPVRALDLARRLAALGAKRFIFTDVSVDGTLTSPNLKALRSIIRETRLPVLASGGVTSTAHLKSIARAGAEGAIVGRALYDGVIDLPTALAAARDFAQDGGSTKPWS